MSPMIPWVPVRHLLRALVVSICLGPGCATYCSWRFGPSPQEYEVVNGDPETPVARVQVAAQGLEKTGSSAQRIEMRFGLRVENQTAAPIQLAPDAFELVDADLQPLGRPSIARATEGEGLAIGPEQEARFEVGFPLPSGAEPDDLDLSSAHLRIGIVHGDDTLTAKAPFHKLRAHAYYRDPWYDPWGDPWWYGPYYHSHIGFQFGYFHHCHHHCH
jgi:hypothetical protein